MAASPFDHPMYRELLGDPEIAGHLSGGEEIATYIRFELALAEACAADGLIPQAAAEAIAAARFTPDIAAIARATARDGVPVPEFVRQLREAVGEPHAGHVHLGATSQDVIDTSLMLRLAPVTTILAQRLSRLATTLDGLGTRFGAHRLMGRTRMQDALPIPAGARIATWSQPLARHLTRLEALRPRLLVLQLGGPVGTLEALGDKGPAVVERMAARLGLGLPAGNWHTQRDSLAEFAAWLSLVTGTLGKIGADIGLMAQNTVGEVALQGSGGSSAMPHKHNPVKAEALVALARYNATLLSAMHHALVAEQERSGAAWTLEWLTLPQMLVGTGAALGLAQALVDSIEGMGEADG